MDKKFPLTLTQRDILFDQLFDISNPQYNIGGYIKCKAIDIERIRTSHRKLVLNHDVFGLKIFQNGDEISQVINDDRCIELSLIDFSKENDPQEVATRWLSTLLKKPLSVFNSQLCFAYLLKLDKEEFWYVGLSHHLAMDGWGFSNWAYKLSNIYNSNKNIDKEDLSFLSMSESDQKYLDSNRYRKDKEFWLEHFSKRPEQLLRPNYKQKFTGHKQIPSTRYRHEIDRKLFELCGKTAKQMGIGVSQLILALLTLYFSSVCDKRSITFGLPAHNRKNFKQKRKIGVFTSISPLTIDIDDEVSFRELAMQIAKLQKECFRHQRFPIGDLMSLIDWQSRDHHLYDINFNYLKLDYADLVFDSLNASVIYHHSGFDSTPLTVTIWDGHGENIELQLDYNHEYFTGNEVSQLASCVHYLLTTVCDISMVDRPLSAFSLLPPSEERVLFNLLSCNLSSKNNKFDLIHNLFEKQVLNRPSAIAVTFAEKSLSYLELDKQANQVAHYLQSQGVGPSSLVGLCVERSLEMLVSLLAILKAGGAYVPLDPSYPMGRLQYIVDETGLSHLISTEGLMEGLKLPLAKVITLDVVEDNSLMRKYPTTSVSNRDQSPTDLAYVIFTSGSTGKPKGVMIAHDALVNFIQAMDERLSGAFAWPNKTLAVTTVSFDIAGLELLGPLCYGGQVVLTSRWDTKDPLRLIQILDHAAINFMQATPATWEMLLSVDWRGKKDLVVLAGGEALPLNLVKSLLSRCQAVWNCYGPTETTVWSLVKRLDESDLVDGKVPIGGPLNNYSHFVLNRHNQLLPLGAVGELHIGGLGLSQGYFNRADLTKERFINNPYYDSQNVHQSSQLYKTGDMVRFLANGNLEFLGRQDNQVKIRGYRVELDEIASYVRAITFVDSAVVVIRNISGVRQLITYFKRVTDCVDQDLQKQVAARLKEQLPDYMIPNIVVEIVEWPLTSNGKIDHNALSTPEDVSSIDEFVPPSTDTEKMLVHIVANLLARDFDNICISRSFFDLGGHSLLAIRLLAAVKSKSGVVLQVEDIFSQDSLQRLAMLIDESASTTKAPLLRAISRDAGVKFPASYAQHRLWFIDRLQDGSPEYNMATAYGVKGIVDVDLLNRVFSSIIERHEILRTVYVEESGLVKQCITDITALDFQISTLDISLLEPRAKNELIEQQMVAAASTPFDLTQDLMLRVNYIKTDVTTGVLLFTMHHIASDGWSISNLAHEFYTLYRAYSEKRPNPLPALTLQYADFAHWQHNHQSHNDFQTGMCYWRRQLEDLPMIHSLPLDYDRPLIKQYKGRQCKGRLESDVVKPLLGLAKAHGLTPFMLLHGALALVLSRHSGSKDIVIGTPVANRLHSELAPLIGFFVNTLVLRTNTQHSTLADYFIHLREMHLAAQRYQTVPFEHIVEALRVVRSQAHSPLFQIMLSLNDAYNLDERMDLKDFGLGDLHFEQMSTKHILSRFDMNLELTLNHQFELHLDWTYDLSLFNATHIEQLNHHLCRLLTGLSQVSDMTKGAQSLPMLSVSEQNYLHSLNPPKTEYAEGLCIHEAFEQRVASAPEALAVVYEDRVL
ncbi:MAG: amino acid adenylation domain-containing protein, partial [Pseudomonadota bacterium]